MNQNKRGKKKGNSGNFLVALPGVYQPSNINSRTRAEASRAAIQAGMAVGGRKDEYDLVDININDDRTYDAVLRNGIRFTIASDWATFTTETGEHTYDDDSIQTVFGREEKGVAARIEKQAKRILEKKQLDDAFGTRIGDGRSELQAEFEKDQDEEEYGKQFDPNTLTRREMADVVSVIKQACNQDFKRAQSKDVPITARTANDTAVLELKRPKEERGSGGSDDKRPLNISEIIEKIMSKLVGHDRITLMDYLRNGKKYKESIQFSNKNGSSVRKVILGMVVTFSTGDDVKSHSITWPRFCCAIATMIFNTPGDRLDTYLGMANGITARTTPFSELCHPGMHMHLYNEKLEPDGDPDIFRVALWISITAMAAACDARTMSNVKSNAENHAIGIAAVYRHCPTIKKYMEEDADFQVMVYIQFKKFMESAGDKAKIVGKRHIEALMDRLRKGDRPSIPARYMEVGQMMKLDL